MSNDLKQLEGLTEEEKRIALQILEQFSKNGSSETYDELLYADYKEIPVDIETFINNPRYLGDALLDEEGKKSTIFPYWVKVLKDIFPSPTEVRYNTVILTGGIGLGKSTVADIGNAYQLYKLLCLKNPYAHFGMQKIDTFTVGFLNNTIDNAKDVAWRKFHNMLCLSPWFLENGVINKLKKDREWEPNDQSGIELLAGSSVNHLIGRAAWGVFIDEVNFSAITSDIDKVKKKMLNLVTGVSIRMQSRFMKGEKNPTVLFIASSKDDDQSFLEQFIETKRKNDSKTTLIIDEPQWKIRTDKDSAIKFKVALGNKFLDNEVVPLSATEQDIQDYINKGYTLLDVPYGYYEQFNDNLDKALRDIAGISTSGISRYLSGPRILRIKTKQYQNAFTKDVIEVGNAYDDNTQYYQFFDLSRIPPELKEKPMYIHLDMSTSGDKTGIAGVWIRGKKPHEEGKPDSKELYYQLAFSVSVKPPKGYQISYEKNRQFIYWLRDQGFRIKGVSTDSFGGPDLGQQLTAQKFKYKVISVDKVNPESKVCDPYQYLKSTIYEERLVLYDKCDLLTKEWVSLERTTSGKIDHPQNGSKDQSDAVCGAIWNASQHAEEYAFEYGDDLESVLLSNEDKDITREQITVDFEDELKRMFDPIAQKVAKQREQTQTKQQPSFMDFGLGAAQVYEPGLVEGGILSW